MSAAIAYERLGSESELGPREWFVHHARYLFACQFASGRDTLDAACGTGYGSALLRRYGATSVTGIDLAPEAIAEARRAHAAPGVTFREGDVLALPAGDRYGAVVSFETIEHVADPERALDALARALRPDGVFVCSTPNRDLTSPGTTRRDAPANPFHRVELSRSELRTALHARFHDVRLYGQLFRFPGPFRRPRRVLESLTAWPTRLPFAPAYLVAVCRRPR